MDEDIKTKADLYRRIRPAMYVKIKEIKKNNHINVSYDELFSYLEDYVWRRRNNLTLYDIVIDILNLEVNELFAYLEVRRKNDKKNQKQEQQ